MAVRSLVVLTRAVALGLAMAGAPVALAQGYDCGRLAAQLAAAGRAGAASQYAAAAQRQRGELARTVAYARNLGCDRTNFLFFGGQRPPQCDAVNAQIERMQANLASLSQAAASDGRAALQARYDAYCRVADGGFAARGFIDRLFDTSRQDRFGDSPTADPDLRTLDPPQDEGPRGGSQALCVRSCDGGYFPMSVSARGRDLDSLQELCTALCPGTEAKLYTRAPGRDLGSAISADGAPYSDMTNAFRFEKTFDRACTCKPAGRGWAEALADAERLLGAERKGDIIVTPEKAEELSRAGASPAPRAARKFDQKAIAKALGLPAPEAARAQIEQQKKAADEATAADAAAAAGAPTAGRESSGIGAAGGDRAPVLGRDAGSRVDEAGPDGARRKVRIIAPTL